MSWYILIIPLWNIHKTYLNDPETEIALIQHNNFVFVGTIIHHVTQSKEGGRIGKNSTPPGRVPFMCYN